MNILQFYEHGKLGKGNLWATENVENAENERDEGAEGAEGADIEIPANGTRRIVTTPATIWGRVLPDTLTGEAAFHAHNDILDLPRNTAFATSILRSAMGEELYGVTARYVLFPEDEGNYEYSYSRAEEGSRARGHDSFQLRLASIQSRIGPLNVTVDILERQSAALETSSESEGDGSKAEQAARALEKIHFELSKARPTIERLSGRSSGSRATDVCVIKLDKTKFSQNFRGNSLDLGHLKAEIDPAVFGRLMDSRKNAPEDLNDLLFYHLLKLHGVLSAEEIRTASNMHPSSSPSHGGSHPDPVRLVFNRN
ncbi:hypothetical protein C8Q76DRAFT_862168 [Earliella scabrosa]|nr:hypothetical protein C8Q76DRAFT_862168 [Earliella scabrosa]